MATRECRDRQRRHVAPFVAIIGGAVLDMLVARQYLTDAQTTDKREVSRALSALLWDTAHPSMRR